MIAERVTTARLKARREAVLNGEPIVEARRIADEDAVVATLRKLEQEGKGLKSIFGGSELELSSQLVKLLEAKLKEHSESTVYPPPATVAATLAQAQAWRAQPVSGAPTAQGQGLQLSNGQWSGTGGLNSSSFPAAKRTAS